MVSNLQSDWNEKLNNFECTVGCKNWLFSHTPKGATASATVYTIVEMTKAHELNIYQYLKYILEHRPSTKMEDVELERLAP